MVATAALLSAPRIASLALRSAPPSCTTFTGAASGTVSRWAHSRIVRAPSGPSMRASRLPASEPVSDPLVVLLDLEPELAELGGHRVGHGPLALGRALDLAQAHEVGDQSLALRRSGTADCCAHRRKATRERARRATRPAPPAPPRERGGGALERIAHELAEERLRAQRARLELGVVLGGDEERVVGQLDDLDQAVVGRGAAEHEPGVLQALAQVVVDLVAVAMALVDHGLVVDRAGAGAVVELHRVGAQAHRAAHVPHFLLLRQQVDHRVGRLGVELGGVGAVHARHVAGELGDGDLHAQADPEVGHVPLAREAGGVDLALDPAHPEAAGHEDAVAGLELALGLLVVQPLRVDPADLHPAAVVGSGVVERLDHGHVGVRELGVLAHQRDAHGRGRGSSIRSTRSSQSDRSGGGASMPKCSSTRSATPSAWNSSGTL